MAYLKSTGAGLIGVCLHTIGRSGIDRRIIASDSKELAIVKMIRVIEENQCCVFFRVEFAAMEKALTVKSGLSN
ncbi:hypothetical protein [Pantoea agglomerans]|uniref:hypothetical protein n=1 Tax=Enterobacter agglomerans TaxID=549 RepID=UPI00057DAA7D|nr:hypothetical protein [Pantoea agglomerans]KIC86699.1 hypothetical protein RN49_11935 [Pantoea agglomerans]MBA5704414.1 hypothetical protein [Pantoea agglomerans]